MSPPDFITDNSSSNNDYSNSHKPFLNDPDILSEATHTVKRANSFIVRVLEHSKSCRCCREILFDKQTVQKGEAEPSTPQNQTQNDDSSNSNTPDWKGGEKA